MHIPGVLPITRCKAGFYQTGLCAGMAIECHACGKASDRYGVPDCMKDDLPPVRLPLKDYEALYQ
jgi:hypothetical protein